MKKFKDGLLEGIPIGLGYLSVSFTFGILAVSYGLNTIEALLISMTTLTSAGQFAGLSIMCTYGSYLEMIIAQLTINMRYSLMSIALSQEVDEDFKGRHRLFLGFFMTDEIFAVAISNKDKINHRYFLGLSCIPYLGWSLGTLLGAIFGEIIPSNISSALGIALYGMFVAIVVPKMRKSSEISIVVLIAIMLSCLFRYTPILKQLSSGFTITICSIIAAFVGAILFTNTNTKERIE